MFNFEKSNMKSTQKIKLILLLFFISVLNLNSQIRIAFFPFQNKDGDMKFQHWCYDLQDSLYRVFLERDPEGQYYQIVPPDSVELLLTEMNMDPANPQYETDMWTAAKKLNARKVVTGNFNYQAERYLINAYIYDVRTKLAHPQFQARDIFKSEERIYESISEITEALLPFFMKNN